MNSQTPAPAAASGMRSLPGWQALIDNRAALTGRHLRDLFAADTDRGERMVVEAEGLRLDFSKNSITGPSSNEGEFATSTTTWAPASASARPSPVTAFTPVEGEAAITPCPC